MSYNHGHERRCSSALLGNYEPDCKRMQRFVTIRDEKSKLPCHVVEQLLRSMPQPAPPMPPPLDKDPDKEKQTREQKTPRTRHNNDLEAMSPTLPLPPLLFDS